MNLKYIEARLEEAFDIAYRAFYKSAGEFSLDDEIDVNLGGLVANAGDPEKTTDTPNAFRTTRANQKVMLVYEMDVAGTVAFEYASYVARIDGNNNGGGFQFSPVVSNIGIFESKQIVIILSVAAIGVHSVGLGMTPGATGNVQVKGPAMAGTAPLVQILGASAV